MDAAAISGAARIVLAAVLGVAAAAKLRARAVTRRQTVALVGDAIGPVVATLLPFVELAIAVMLLVWWSAVPGIAATILLLAFTVVIVRAELRHLPCPCFGAGSSAQAVGPAAVVRNAALVVCAVLATASPRGASVGAVAGALVVLGAAVAGALWLARTRPATRSG